MEEAVALDTLLHEEMALYDLEADCWEDVVRQMAACAIEHGYATEGYAEDVIERENLYPTGLPTEVMKVAVPHAMIQDHVLAPAIVPARLAHPVDFKEMGDGVNDVACDMVFMLVAKGDKEHLSVLQQLISIFANPELMGRLVDVGNARELVERVIELAGEVEL